MNVKQLMTVAGRRATFPHVRQWVRGTSAFLYGLGRADIKPHELDYHDPDHEMLITVRATKPATTGGAA